MFRRWADIVIHHPRRVLLVALAVLIVLVGAMATMHPNLQTEGYLGDSSESMQVHARLASEWGIGGDTIVIMVESPSSLTAPESLQAINTAVAGLRTHPELAGVLTPLDHPEMQLVSADGHTALVLVPVAPNQTLDSATLDQIAADVRAASPDSALSFTFGGNPYVGQEIEHDVRAGLARAEMVSIPLTLIILVVVFGSLVAAGMPLLVGVATIILALAIMLIASTMGFQSVFATNIITMLGLGLGVDYSLFLVTRYREELARTSPEDALRMTIGSVGKAIFFSGVTVMIGLGATQFFPMPMLQSLGQAGIVVTAAAMFFGLTLLPATLRLLGHRINAVTIWRRGGADSTGESAFWHRVASQVMARPWLLLVVCMLVLAVFASPLRDLNLNPGGPEVLPLNSPARHVSGTMIAEFSTDDSNPIFAIVNSTDQMTITDFQTRIGALDGVREVTIIPGEGNTLLRVTSASSARDSGQIVRDIRGMSTAATPVTVGGAAAMQIDTIQSIRDGLAPAAIFIVVAAYIVLLLTFGSILLPLKAIFMGALSISASVGVVVWGFQHDHLAGLLNFDSGGATVAMVPILIACILFGLSMDYEVLLLSRIQEEYQATGDNRHAVATGLAHTGQVVSGAATIMVVVFAGFVLADVLIIKSLGFGLAFAVALDATLVRGVLVPSTMRLLGRWNWWAPAWVTRLVQRMGVSHVEAAQPDDSMPLVPFGPALKPARQRIDGR